MSSVLRSSGKLVIGIGIFVGLPLIGWGIADIREFIDHPARLKYAILAALLQLFIVIRFPEAGDQRTNEHTITRRERLKLIPLQVIPLAIVLAAPYRDRHSIVVMGEPEVLRYPGLLLFAAGLLLMHWAENILGKQFSVYVRIRDDHQLVTGGVYRYLRHPRYLGIILFNAGISLIFRSWFALLLVAVLTLVLIWRIWEEEALMREEFGTDWDVYVHKSWRLIPFVY